MGLLCVPLCVAIALPAAAAPPQDRQAQERAWDEALGEQGDTPSASTEPGATTTTTTTTTVPAPVPPPVAPVAAPVYQDVPEAEIQARRREGNGLLIGAGVALALASVANGLRAFVVVDPCQTDDQTGCRAGWFMTSTVAWAMNATAITLAGVGGKARGAADATDRAPRHRERRGGLIAGGAILLALGMSANIALRTVWIIDYSTPGGDEALDFAVPTDAAAYYGGLQLSSLAIAAGVGSLAYGGARAMKRRVVLTPMLGGRMAGLQLSGRF